MMANVTHELDFHKKVVDLLTAHIPVAPFDSCRLIFINASIDHAKISFAQYIVSIWNGQRDNLVYGLF